jgi:CitMHS family citrate-Mg2+:H+ or citrate-Ca2+:H+ symporter
MLTFLGISMIMCFMYLIMTKRLSALVALILIPVIFALIGWGLGFHIESLSHIEVTMLGENMLEGIKKLAPTGVMLLFAIMYFALMIDSGLFDPSIKWILKMVKGDPLKITLGTVFLTLTVSLDGDGSTTYMICVAAMMPLYKRIGMNPGHDLFNASIERCDESYALGRSYCTCSKCITSRCQSRVYPYDSFDACSNYLVIFLAYLYGKYERKRLGVISIDDISHADNLTISKDPDAQRPHLRWFNGILTLVLMAALVKGILPMPILFMLGFCIALVVNYPCLQMQKKRIATHADSVLAVVGVIFAAGVFTGILTGTGMVESMSKQFVALIPASMGPYMAPITGALSMPLTFFMSNDAFYFGVLPILAEAATQYGIEPVEIARASIIGQPIHLLSPLVPSTYLLCGLAAVEFADHQKFTLKWAFMTCCVLMGSALVFGVFHWSV